MWKMDEYFLRIRRNLSVVKAMDSVAWLAWPVGIETAFLRGTTKEKYCYLKHCLQKSIGIRNIFEEIS